MDKTRPFVGCRGNVYCHHLESIISFVFHFYTYNFNFAFSIFHQYYLHSGTCCNHNSFPSPSLPALASHSLVPDCQYIHFCELGFCETLPLCIYPLRSNIWSLFDIIPSMFLYSNLISFVFSSIVTNSSYSSSLTSCTLCFTSSLGISLLAEKKSLSIADCSSLFKFIFSQGLEFVSLFI